MTKRTKATSTSGELFPNVTNETRERRVPLAEKMRPQTWEEFVGLDALDPHLVHQLKAGSGRPPSLILWGQPGSGKTTLAKLIGKSFDCEFIELSAVLAGVQDVRAIVAEATTAEKPTILFVDEIHRFNKAQQDAFLPHVEAGTISLIGATTENPSFSLTAALLSRCRVVVLPTPSREMLHSVLQRVAEHLALRFSPEAAVLLAEMSAGDARRLVSLVEDFVAARAASGVKAGDEINDTEIKKFIEDTGAQFYDRSGEEHYNQVSAFIKSMRGSDADAALYWGFRMIMGGEDPRFIIRRLMIFASEDIGNADPRALQLAVATSDAFERLGMPEGRIPIAHCITYLATAPKSNRSYMAMHSALAAIKRHGKVAVPLHLRNAPTGLMKSLGYGAEYEYPHEHQNAYVGDVRYLPDEVGNAKFYEPSERGYEKTIKERLEFLATRGK